MPADAQKMYLLRNAGADSAKICQGKGFWLSMHVKDRYRQPGYFFQNGKDGIILKKAMTGRQGRAL
jgi:hypothetical protein